MTYLYGDSSDSGLELNYIELLRDFLDFAVQIMLSEQRIEESLQSAEEQKSAVNNELDELRTLGEAVGRALEQSKTRKEKSATNKTIAALRSSTQDTLRRTAEGLKAQVAASDQEILQRKKRERAGNAKITERLLLHHELPDSHNTVGVSMNSEETAYDARVSGSCKQGLQWVFAAEIPAKNQFHQPLKVAALVSELSIDLPEMSGFVRKSVKLKPYRISTLYITDLASAGKELLLKLRTTPVSTEPTGLDIRANSKTKGVTAQRIDKGEEAAPFQLSDSDAAAVLSICEGLDEDRLALVEYRAKLIALLFDGKDLSECPDPKILLRRLIDRIGPIIQEIAKHSLAESELVLKRVLANDRREEIFASRADLISKVSGVSISLRGIFAPLGLGDLGLTDGPNSDKDVDPPTKKQTTLAELEKPIPQSNRPHLKRSDSAPTLADLSDDEATNIASGPPTEPPEDTVHVMTAMAPDENETDPGMNPFTVAAGRKRPTQERASQKRPTKAPPGRKKNVPSKLAPRPDADSIDIALAELESEP